MRKKAFTVGFLAVLVMLAVVGGYLLGRLGQNAPRVPAGEKAVQPAGATESPSSPLVRVTVPEIYPSPGYQPTMHYTWSSRTDTSIPDPALTPPRPTDPFPDDWEPPDYAQPEPPPLPTVTVTRDPYDTWPPQPIEPTPLSDLLN